MKPLRISVVQMDQAWHNPAKNKATIQKLLKSSGQATDVIVLPEMFTTGFTMQPEAWAEAPEGPTQVWMEKLAAQYDALVVGSYIVREDFSYYNRMVMVSPEGVLGEYDKRHLFTLAEEDAYYEPGQDWVRVQYKGWRILPQICYDLRFPVWSRNRPEGEGLSYDLLLYVANWPAPRVLHWDTLLRARAIENQSFVVGCNRIGTDGNGLPYVGSSAIISPKGEELAWQRDTATVLQATLDPETLATYRHKYPFWKDGDVFEVIP